MRVFLSGIFLGFFAFLVSCRDSEVKVYKIAKDPGSDAEVDRGEEVYAPYAGGSAPYANKANPALVDVVEEKIEVQTLVSWNLPEGWAELPVSRMVKAKFQAGDATVSISDFPGTVGGDLANVNRWLGQIGLPTVGGDELSDLIQLKQMGGKPYKYVQLEGSSSGMDAAWIFDGERSYFIKLTGSAASVKEQRANFEAFIVSFVWE